MTRELGERIDRERPRRRRAAGPNPGVVALVALVLTVLGVVLLAALSGGAAVGSPFQPAEELLQRYRENVTATRVASWLQVGSAVPLGVATATFFARQQRLGVRVPGPAIGFFGGVLACVMLLLSGLIGWVLSRPEALTSAGGVQTLSLLAFITGGVGFVLGIGLLIAGVAVPAFILGLLPRWLAVAGLVIAACAEASFFSMVIDPAQVLLPVGRFLGLLWLVVAGFLLPVDRAAARTAA